MHKRMPTRPPLDLPQANQIPALEVAATMFEFPKSALGVASVENITLYTKQSLEA
jgi:hypothetical protein